jgi:hypothetical protein
MAAPNSGAKSHMNPFKELGHLNDLFQKVGVTVFSANPSIAPSLPV